MTISDITSVPSEILVEMLSHLDGESLKSTKLVCRQFRAIIDQKPDLAGAVLLSKIKRQLSLETLDPHAKFSVLLELAKIEPRCYDQAEKLAREKFQGDALEQSLAALIAREAQSNRKKAYERVDRLHDFYYKCSALLEIAKTEEIPNFRKIEKMLFFLQEYQKDDILTQMAAVQARYNLPQALEMVGRVSELGRDPAYFAVIDARSLVDVDGALQVVELITDQEVQRPCALVHIVKVLASRDFPRALALANTFQDLYFRFQAYLELAQIQSAYIAHLKQMAAQLGSYAEVQIAELIHADKIEHILPPAEDTMRSQQRAEVLAKIAEKQAAVSPPQAFNTACTIKIPYIQAQAFVKIAQIFLARCLADKTK